MRRIVVDTSVMIAAFFSEHIILNGLQFDVSARARPIVASIAAKRVHALAPDALFAEFLTTAARFAFDRSGGQVLAPDDVRNSIFEFFSLPITLIPANQIDTIALDLVFSERVSPPDAWFVAAAIQADAELWYSHRHKDGIVEHAEQFHPQKVFVLTERRFQ